MIHIFLLEQTRSIGEMMTLSLHLEPDIEVVGCSDSIVELSNHLRWCDVILVNEADTRADSPELGEVMRQASTRAKLVAVGVQRRRESLEAWAQAGVAGCVYRDQSFAELLRTIRAVHTTRRGIRWGHGSASTPPPVVSTSNSDMSGDSETQLLFHTLTRREREVLRLLQQGLTNQEIAAALVIELGTTKNHVHNILRKLNITSRRETFRLSRPTLHPVAAPQPSPERARTPVLAIANLMQEAR